MWHINADEPSILDYDMTFKGPAEDALYAPDPFRSSDHDPVIIGLALDSVGPTVDIELQPHRALAAEPQVRHGHR